MRHMRIVLIFSLFISIDIYAEELISSSEVEVMFSESNFDAPLSNVIRKQIEIGKDTTISFEFGVTSKGNGVIELPGISLLRLYDKHDDLSYFKNGLLNNELIDLNSDGYKDILLWGMAVLSDDEGKINEETSVLAVLIYSPTDRIYQVIRASKEIDIYIDE